MTSLPSPPLETDHRAKRLYPDRDQHSHGHGYGVPGSTSTTERRLGDTEASYYLPARESGVNDMYLHIGLRAPSELLFRSRVRLVWAILRARHPLLRSQVEMHTYEDIRFVCKSSLSVTEALEDADRNLEYRAQSKDELIDAYLNGPRTLSNTRLSYLVISQTQIWSGSLPTPPVSPPKSTLLYLPDESHLIEANILICATHFLGDGMALHNFGNDFFGMLGGSMNQDDLQGVLTQELRCQKEMPNALEDRFPPAPTGRFLRAAYQVDFQQSQSKLIGGHSFPRKSGSPRHTIVPTISIDQDRTRLMLKSCKAHGVSISSALFAVCNIAWSRTYSERRELPLMMYSALNLRPYLAPSMNDSYWFLAIGYFNVVLPSFIPRSQEDLLSTFWHRARLSKNQSSQAAKSPMIISRSREMAQERGRRARMWAEEDDYKARGQWNALPTPPAETEPSKPPPLAPTVPSTALIGLSLLGNLDGIYKHESFGKIKLHTLTTGSRQRSGGMLLFGYTFCGKLWISLGYDENGFDEEVVNRFWRNVLDCADKLLTT